MIESDISDDEPPVEETDDYICDSMTQPLRIEYLDSQFVGVFKPAGLVVHRSKMTHPDEPVLLQRLRNQLDQFVYPVHRLDRPTAGLILLGLSSEAARRLGSLFTDRHITKHYQALVRGWTPDSGTIDRPLRDRFDEDWIGKQNDAPEQDAVTHYTTLERFTAPWPIGDFSESRFSLIEVHLETGRWHQIRRHLNHIAHPVIGDHRHGDHRWNQMVYRRTGIYRMMLTSMRLEFRHPFTDEHLSILVGRGSSFDRLVELLRSFAQPSP